MFRRIIKLRIEGPLNLTLQQRTLRQINKLNINRTSALLVILNSYGGSLEVAKNISLQLTKLQTQKVPVYCFAEEYCLNSTNLILMSGKQSFASRFSVMGDFGYAKENIQFQGLKARIGVDRTTVGTYEPKIDNLGQLKDLSLQQKLVQSDTQELKTSIFHARRQALVKKGLSSEVFKSKLKGGSMDPKEAFELGLLDGLETCQSFLLSRGIKGWVREDRGEPRQRLLGFYQNMIKNLRLE